MLDILVMMGTRVVKSIAKIATIAKLRIAIARNRNFANKTIRFFK